MAGEFEETIKKVVPDYHLVMFLPILIAIDEQDGFYSLLDETQLTQRRHKPRLMPGMVARVSQLDRYADAMLTSFRRASLQEIYVSKMRHAVTSLWTAIDQTQYILQIEHTNNLPLLLPLLQDAKNKISNAKQALTRVTDGILASKSVSDAIRPALFISQDPILSSLSCFQHMTRYSRADAPLIPRMEWKVGKKTKQQEEFLTRQMTHAMAWDVESCLLSEMVVSSHLYSDSQAGYDYESVLDVASGTKKPKSTPLRLFGPSVLIELCRDSFAYLNSSKEEEEVDDEKDAGGGGGGGGLRRKLTLSTTTTTTKPSPSQRVLLVCEAVSHTVKCLLLTRDEEKDDDSNNNSDKNNFVSSQCPYPAIQLQTFVAPYNPCGICVMWAPTAPSRFFFSDRNIWMNLRDASNAGEVDLFMSDTGNNRILRVTRGEIRVIAGSGAEGHLDGSAVHAQFNGPQGICVVSDSSLIIADTENHCLRLLRRRGQQQQQQQQQQQDDSSKASSIIAATGGGNDADDEWHVSTIAGVPRVAGNRDGPAKGTRDRGALLTRPMALAVTPSGEIVFSEGGSHVGSHGGHCVRILSADRNSVWTIAGSPGVPGAIDGVGMDARFDSPHGLAIFAIPDKVTASAAPNRKGVRFGILVADTNNNKIRMIRTSSTWSYGSVGIVSTVIGNGRKISTPGIGRSAQVNAPVDVVISSTDGCTVYVLERGSKHISVFVADYLSSVRMGAAMTLQAHARRKVGSTQYQLILDAFRVNVNRFVDVVKRIRSDFNLSCDLTLDALDACEELKKSARCLAFRAALPNIIADNICLIGNDATSSSLDGPLPAPTIDVILYGPSLVVGLVNLAPLLSDLRYLLDVTPQWLLAACRRHFETRARRIVWGNNVDANIDVEFLTSLQGGSNGSVLVTPNLIANVFLNDAFLLPVDSSSLAFLQLALSLLLGFSAGGGEGKEFDWSILEDSTISHRRDEEEVLNKVSNKPSRLRHLDDEEIKKKDTKTRDEALAGASADDTSLSSSSKKEQEKEEATKPLSKKGGRKKKGTGSSLLSQELKIGMSGDAAIAATAKSTKVAAEAGAGEDGDDEAMMGELGDVVVAGDDKKERDEDEEDDEDDDDDDEDDPLFTGVAGVATGGGGGGGSSETAGTAAAAAAAAAGVSDAAVQSNSTTSDESRMAAVRRRVASDSRNNIVLDVLRRGVARWLSAVFDVQGTLEGLQSILHSWTKILCETENCVARGWAMRAQIGYFVTKNFRIADLISNLDVVLSNNSEDGSSSTSTTPAAAVLDVFLSVLKQIASKQSATDVCWWALAPTVRNINTNSNSPSASTISPVHRWFIYELVLQSLARDPQLLLVNGPDCYHAMVGKQEAVLSLWCHIVWFFGRSVSFEPVSFPAKCESTSVQLQQPRRAFDGISRHCLQAINFFTEALDLLRNEDRCTVRLFNRCLALRQSLQLLPTENREVSALLSSVEEEIKTASLTLRRIRTVIDSFMPDASVLLRRAIVAETCWESLTLKAIRSLLHSNSSCSSTGDIDNDDDDDDNGEESDFGIGSKLHLFSAESGENEDHDTLISRSKSDPSSSSSLDASGHLAPLHPPPPSTLGSSDGLTRLPSQVTKLPSLPLGLITGVDWYSKLLHSELFKLMIEKQRVDGLVGYAALRAAASTWKRLFSTISLGITSTIEFEWAAPFFIRGRGGKDEQEDEETETSGGNQSPISSEALLLAMTAANNNNNGSNKITANDSDPTAWAAQVGNSAREFLKTRDRVLALDSVAQVVVWSKPLVSEEVVPFLNEIDAVVIRARKCLEETSWTARTLANISELSSIVSALPEQVIGLKAQIVQSVVESRELLVWLRQMPNDANFTSAIEMAMGKPEIECPVELWQAPTVPGELGRVDETILSMLMDVRQAFRPYIFRPTEKFLTIDSFLSTFTTMQEDFDVDDVMKAVKTCSSLLAPLMELIEDESDEAAVNRLHELLLPSKCAVWVISNKEETEKPPSSEEVMTATTTTIGSQESGDFVTQAPILLRLEFSVKRRNQHIVKSLSLQDLLEFQSTVILGKSSEDFRTVMVDKFVQQLQWLRVLAEQLENLRTAGHFHFQRVHETFSTQADPAVLRSWALRARDIAESWSHQVEKTRLQWKSLNYFSISQLSRIVLGLEEEEKGDEKEGKLLGLINELLPLAIPFADNVVPREDLAVFIECVKTEWRETKEASETNHADAAGEDESSSSSTTLATRFSKTTNAARLLENCGRALQKSLQALIDSTETTTTTTMWLSPSSKKGEEQQQHQQRVEEEEEGGGGGLRPQQRRRREQRSRLPSSSLLMASNDQSIVRGDVPLRQDVGVHIVIAEKPEEVTPLILSCFAMVGQYPLRHELTMCNSYTTWEQICNQITLWVQSGKNNNNNDDGNERDNDNSNELGSRRRIHVIAWADYLPYEVQRKACTLLLETMPDASCGPLIFILSSRSASSHISAVFSHRERSSQTLMLETHVITSIWQNAISQRHPLGVCVFSSRRPGAGKSFAARMFACEAKKKQQQQQQANKNNEDGGSVAVAHVPINGPISEIGLIHRIQNSLRAASSSTTVFSDSDVHHFLCSALHFDLAHSVPPSFNALLLQLILFDGILDPHSGRLFSWQSSRMQVSIELSSGPGDLLSRIALCGFLPRVEVELSRNSFCGEYAMLRAGMGADFDCASFDASSSDSAFTSMESQDESALLLSSSSSGSAANAFVRLQRVCRILSKGTRSSPMLPGPVCFDLLTKWNRSRHKSLWNIWSLVNVLYWQFSEMLAPASPVMTKLLGGRASSSEVSSQILGQLIEFAARTASSFTSCCLRAERIISNSGNGHCTFDRLDSKFNGKWDQVPFDNDGRPCFRFQHETENSLYLYFRANEDRWVIDSTIRSRSPFVLAHSEGPNLTTVSWQRRSIPMVAAQTAPKVEGNTVVLVGEGEERISTRGNPWYGKFIEAEPPGCKLFVSLAASSTATSATAAAAAVTASSTINALVWVQSLTRWYIVQVNSSQFSSLLSALTDSAKSYLVAEIEKGIPEFRVLAVSSGTGRDSYHCIEGDRMIGIADVRVTMSSDSLREAANGSSEEGGGGGGAAAAIVVPRTTPPATDAAAEIAKELDLINWSDSDIECILVSRSVEELFFLAQNERKMRDRMHPTLLQTLQSAGFTVGEQADRLGQVDKHVQILSALTNVSRSPEEMHDMLSGRFCLTGDGLLKMLAIFVRVRCGIPVVLMGEAGCGKTFLIRFLCEWLGSQLIVLDVHGGTSAEDIVHVFEKAEKLVHPDDRETGGIGRGGGGGGGGITRTSSRSGKRAVYVFLDEINTCGHMGLLTEVICKRSVNGRRISDEIQVLAALNPYRLRSVTADSVISPGLVFHLNADKKAVAAGGSSSSSSEHHRHVSDEGYAFSSSAEMARLVYRVASVPSTLRDFIFDFGSLNERAERTYIRSMVASELDPLKATFGEKITIENVILSAQSTIRKFEGDSSACSLRDVRRFLSLTKWFAHNSAFCQLASPNFGRSYLEVLSSAKAMFGKLSQTQLIQQIERLCAVLAKEAEEKQAAAAESSGTGGGAATTTTSTAGATGDSQRLLNLKTKSSTSAATSRSLFEERDRLFAEILMEYQEKMSQSAPKVLNSTNSCREFVDSLAKNKSVDELALLVCHGVASGKLIAPGLSSCEYARRWRNSFPHLPPVAVGVCLSLALVYCYRLAKNVDRGEFWECVRRSNHWDTPDLPWSLGLAGEMESVVDRVQRAICETIAVGEGIAVNSALTENLFVTTVCVLNRIPVFIVGKPGTSKTLTLQIIGSNLQGKQSPHPFWKAFPAVYIVQYQCSPLSSSQAILHQFNIACSYQAVRDSSQVITILLLDEVGLAEHSPDMPLKCLHQMLVDPPVAIVGLSNWELDRAKMNRGICLNRTEPSEVDIQMTGEKILSSVPFSARSEEGANGAEEEGGSGESAGAITRSGSGVVSWLGPLAAAYHEIYTRQKGRDFIGMRDLYSLIKQLKRALSSASSSSSSSSSSKSELTPDLLTQLLCRNFGGGSPEATRRILESFHLSCFDARYLGALCPVRELISSNLADYSARHLMILTRGGTALPLLTGCGLLDTKTSTVLFGSEFPEDSNELFLVQQISSVKSAMASGSVVVLQDHDNIYEALYDVLNQRYLMRTEEGTGRIRRMLRLAVGARSQLCPVADTFKIIVIVEQQHAYEDLDLPLLNRFEKQVLTAADLIGKEQSAMVKSLGEWVVALAKSLACKSPSDIFCGWNADTIASLVLTSSNFDDSYLLSLRLKEGGANSFEQRLRRKLAMVSFPVISLLSHQVETESLAGFLSVEEYTRNHASLAAALENYVFVDNDISPQEEQLLFVVLTHSPAAHLQVTVASWNQKQMAAIAQKITIISLAECSSENYLVDSVRRFMQQATAATTATPDQRSVLFVQCDPLVCSASLINHAKYIVMKEMMIKSESTKRNVAAIFVLHMPPAFRQSTRSYDLNIHAPWQHIFVDDLRNEDGIEPPLREMMSKSTFELALSGLLDVRHIIRSRFQSALAACPAPTPSENSEYFSHPQRILHLRDLLFENEDKDSCSFLQFCYDLVMVVLQSQPPADMRNLLSISSSGATGSLRQFLYLHLQNTVVSSFAHVLRLLDTNFNLMTLPATKNSSCNNSNDNNNDHFDIRQLWFSLASSSSILDRGGLAGSSVGRLGVVSPPPNTGKHGITACRFPFSWSLIQLLNSEENRAALENDVVVNGNLRVVANRLEIIANLALKVGEDSGCGHWKTRGLAFLYDFVASATTPLPGLSVDEQVGIYEAVIKATTVDGLANPANVTALIWHHERRLFHLCSLISMQQIHRKVRNQIFSAIIEIAAQCAEGFSKDGSLVRVEEGGGEFVVENLRRVERCLDFCVIFSVIAVLEVSARACAVKKSGGGSSWQSWSSMAAAALSQCEGLLLLSSSSSSSFQASNLNSDTCFDFSATTNLIEQIMQAARKSADCDLFDRDVSTMLRYRMDRIKILMFFADEIGGTRASVVGGAVANFVASRHVFDEQVVLLVTNSHHLQVDSASTSPAFSCSFLSNLFDAANAASGSIDGTEMVAHFARRVLSEVVLPRCSACVENSDSLELLMACGRIVCGKESEESRYLGLSALSLPLRRTLTRILLQQFLLATPSSPPLLLLLLSPRDKANLVQTMLGSPEGVQLVIYSLEDAGVEKWLQEGSSFFQGREKDLIVSAAAGSLILKEDRDCSEYLTGAFRYLYSVVAVRALVSATAANIFIRTSKARNVESILDWVKRSADSDYFERWMEEQSKEWMAKLDSLPMHLSEAANARLLTLKLVYANQGAEGLARIFALPPAESVPWLNEIASLSEGGEKAKETVSRMDALANPFPFFVGKDIFTKICDIFTRCNSSPSNWVAAIESVTWKSTTEQMGDDYHHHQQHQDFTNRIFAASISAAAFGLNIVQNRSLVDEILKWIASCGRFCQKSLAVMRWAIHGCPLIGLTAEDLHDHHQQSGNSTAPFIQQTALHLAIRGLLAPNPNLLSALLFDWELVKKSYLPTMPLSDLFLITNAMPSAGLYRCPNGHVFVITECTRPMQVGRCIECGVEIGGRDHVPLPGSERIPTNSEGEVDVAPVGYLPQATYGEKAESVMRSRATLTPCTIRVLRLMMHSLILTSATIQSLFSQSTGSAAPPPPPPPPPPPSSHHRGAGSVTSASSTRSPLEELLGGELFGDDADEEVKEEDKATTHKKKNKKSFSLSASLNYLKSIMHQHHGSGNLDNVGFQNCIRFLAMRLSDDWTALQKRTQLPDAELCIAVHVMCTALVSNGGDGMDASRVFLKSGPLAVSAKDSQIGWPAIVRTSMEREALEVQFQLRVIEPVFNHRNLRSFLGEIKQNLVASDAASCAKQIIGEEVWGQVLEVNSKSALKNSDGDNNSASAAAAACWLLRRRVTFETVIISFEARANNATEYPLLSSFFRNENRLSTIKHIAAIMNWHRVLFDALPSNLTREEASSMSSLDFIARFVPSEKRKEALVVLDAFCEAFNDSFHLVTYLHECQRNPFLVESRGSGGRGASIDLSGLRKPNGTGEKMSRNTPVAFSLPSVMPAGETDAAGLCTVQLLHILAAAHNEVLAALEEATSRQVGLDGNEFARVGDAENNEEEEGSSSSSISSESSEEENSQSEEQVGAGGGGGVQVEAIPPLSHNMSVEAIRRQLIDYDREAMLMPLLRDHVVQPLDPGCGWDITFDFPSLERSLANGLLGHGCSQVRLAVRHIEYAGELKRSGKLSALAVRVEQIPLAPGARSALVREVDTSHAVTRILSLLEDCVRFLAQIGGNQLRHVDGNMTLDRYVRSILLLPQDQWEEISTPTLSSVVQLKHLVSVILTLEEVSAGSPAQQADEKYRKQLSPAQKSSLQTLSMLPDRLVSDVLLGLRELLSEQLAASLSPTFSPNLSLKEFLSYTSALANNNNDADEEKFERLFPDDLSLAHTAAVFELLASGSGSNSNK